MAEKCLEHENIDFSVLEKLTVSVDGDLMYNGMILATKNDLDHVSFDLDENGIMRMVVDGTYLKYDENENLQVLIDGVSSKINEQGKLEVLIYE